MEVKSESEVAQSCPTLGTPWTVAHQAPPSMGFSRQEYRSGLPLPSPLLFEKTEYNEYLLTFFNTKILFHFHVNTSSSDGMGAF